MAAEERNGLQQATNISTSCPLLGRFLLQSSSSAKEADRRVVYVQAGRSALMTLKYAQDLMGRNVCWGRGSMAKFTKPSYAACK